MGKKNSNGKDEKHNLRNAPEKFASMFQTEFSLNLKVDTGYLSDNEDGK